MAVQEGHSGRGDPERGEAHTPTSATSSSSKAKDDDTFWNVILGLLLLLVCVMLWNEAARHWKHRQQVFWDDHYLAAVRSDPNDWKFGWRLEDLEQRLHSQHATLNQQMVELDVGLPSTHTGFMHRVSEKWKHQQHDETSLLTHHDSLSTGFGKLTDSIDRLGRQQHEHVARRLFAHVENGTALHTIACAARPQYLLRVGPDDFRDVATDRCQVFSAGRGGMPGGSAHVGAHELWERVDLGSGAVGFRALSNGKFLKVVAPKSDDWNAPWKTEVVSPLPGLAERFQVVGTMLYSELMHGYLQCSGSQLAEGLKGFPGETLYEDSTIYHFNFTKASPQVVSQARTLRAASNHIISTQNKQLTQVLALRKATGASAGLAAHKTASAHIALVVPMTSRGTDMGTVEQSPFWFNLFASFMESIDWNTNKHDFTFYLGLDHGDLVYDTGDAWGDLRKSFLKNTRRALTWLNYDNSTQRAVLQNRLHLKLMHFDGLQGAPSQVVVGLVNQAFADGCDYFFQVNDDTVIVSTHWADSFVNALASNPVHPNLGITGPVDTNNDRILTHAFAHRTHIEIFGSFFPAAFKNWWSDDWISTVYGSLHTFRQYDVLVTHNVQSQKTGAFNRYAVDESAQFSLRRELRTGFVAINSWLKNNKLPTLPLPAICYYSPLIGDLHGPMLQAALGVTV